MEATNERVKAIMEAFKTIKPQVDSFEQLIRNLGISDFMDAQCIISTKGNPPIQLLHGRMYQIGTFGIAIYAYIVSGSCITVDTVFSFIRMEEGVEQRPEGNEIVKLFARIHPLNPNMNQQVNGAPTWKKVRFPTYGQSGDGSFGALMDILSVPTKEDHDDYLTQERAMGVIGCLVAGAINLTQEDVPD